MRSRRKSAKPWISLVVFLIIATSAFFYYKEGTLPVDKNNNEPVLFVIRKGEDLNSIIQNLEKEKLIRNRVVFFFIVKQMGIEKDIQAGTFRLSTAMTPNLIAKELTQGSEDIWVTIIEGLRQEEIADVIARDLGIPTAEFLQSAREGYLFPDTYLIPRTASAETVHKILADNFDSKYTDEIAAKAKARGLSQDEVIKLASIVEKEGRGEDRSVVASVLLRRFKENYPLQADATVQYALGYQPDIKKWWKPVLSLDDLKLESPYNTYTNPGLPPQPISNPGMSSIEAVVNADPNTPYFFYLHSPDGRVHPARDNDEHEENKRKYL